MLSMLPCSCRNLTVSSSIDLLGMQKFGATKRDRPRMVLLKGCRCTFAQVFSGGRQSISLAPEFDLSPDVSSSSGFYVWILELLNSECLGSWFLHESRVQGSFRSAKVLYQRGPCIASGPCSILSGSPGLPGCLRHSLAGTGASVSMEA